MKCFRCFSFALFALLGVFFGSFIINQNDTYAVDDVSYTFDSSSSTTVLCQTSTSSPCSNYSYITITYNGSSLTDRFALFFYTSPTSSTSFYFPAFTSVLFLPGSSYFSVRAYPGSSTISSGSSYTVTLSENNPFSGSTPSGSIELTENGTYDVSQYAEAVVNVPETDCPPSSGGDYHNDLVAINNSIMICAATCLVIYFFYCIYRMIIKNSGVK